jgi:RNA polymerase sigma-70 factor (ECF subfamily)
MTCHTGAAGRIKAGMPDDPDQLLVERARAGLPDAFPELVRRHTRAVYRVALRFSGNPSDAEEILQETFLQFHRSLASFRAEARVSTWLYRIAVNAALMHLRRQVRHQAERLDDHFPRFDERGRLARLDIDYSVAARADRLIEARELYATALAALASLPEAYRMPFVLRDLEELGTEETAEILGLSVSVVRQRVHRARLALRARLSALAGGEA